MSRRDKILLWVLLPVFFLPVFVIAKGLNPSIKDLREGDVIFHASDSRQAPMLRYATMSPVTHCGIIVEKGGKLYVLEAEGKVQLTTIDKFVERGIGKIYMVRRPKKKLGQHISYKQFLGMKYDMAFKFGNGKYYCSELVYDIYRNQFGIQLCEPRPLSDYNTLGILKEAKRRGMEKNQLMVAPSDLLNSDYFVVVR